MLDISIEIVILPSKPLNKIELEDAARKLEIPYFRGVFVRDALPKNYRNKECGILNLDDAGKRGTHWVAWYKNDKNKIYFDSYDIKPPTVMIEYLGSSIHYNSDQLQQAG